VAVNQEQFLPAMHKDAWQIHWDPLIVAMCVDANPMTRLMCRCNETAISLRAGCELFLRYTTRTSNLETEDFETSKQRIIEVHGAQHTIRFRA